MSSRALRKLRKDKQPDVPALCPNFSGDDDLIEEELEADSVVVIAKSSGSRTNSTKNAKSPVNPFDLLNEDDDSSLKDDNEYDVDHHREDEDRNQHNNVATKKKKKKKKKKLKSNAAGSAENKDNDDIDAVIREVSEIYGDTATGLSRDDRGELENYTTFDMRALLNVEHKYLNPENEMRRIFGSRVVQNDQSRRRNRNRQYHKSTWLAQPKDSWPHMGKSGLSMSLLENKQGNQHFAFEHSKSYQDVEFKFLEAVESYNPQNIVNVLNLQSYHINSLLQLSEVCKMSEDIQMATELIERALYAFESSFHPLFSFTQGTCRLDYRRPENRAFYVALFRHLVFVGQRGCYRTSLELCKLLLSLDPDNDPLCVLLMIDFYALRSEQFEFLIKMYDQWEAHRNLTYLPNFAFSIPLAMFHLALKNGSDAPHADKLLQNALLMFPGMLLPLLNECNVKPDPKVSSNSFFTSGEQSCPDALKQLMALYIGRCSSCWKAPEVMLWLERNVHRALEQVEGADRLLKEFAEKRQLRYRGTPRNIYRHVLISEIKDAKAALPPELANTPILSYDPLPPPDSIISYKPPERPKRLQDPSVLNMFFRSLMPNFDVQNPPEMEGAVGGGEDGANIRQSIGNLMEAMRNMLSNIQPVPPPNEDHEDNENDQRNDEEWE